MEEVELVANSPTSDKRGDSRNEICSLVHHRQDEFGELLEELLWLAAAKQDYLRPAEHFVHKIGRDGQTEPLSLVCLNHKQNPENDRY